MVNPNILYLITLFTGLFLLNGKLTAQVGATPGQDPDPTVALVLSGGGAHGLAHIGVIRYLEEHGIEADIVTGTSMGAIIGGLYAMGYDSHAIERIARENDLPAVLRNEMPLSEVAPSEKFYEDKTPLSLIYDDDEFRLPREFLNSQRLDLLISRIFNPARNISNFDDLPRPFRCIAVDIVTGEVIVLDSGYLGKAIRASMAIPSVFAPVELDGHLLVDGGLIRNFPVSEAENMGADLIIGVYVGSFLEEGAQLNSMVDMLNQSTFMMGFLDSEQQKEKVDILIEPDVKDMGKFDFENIGEFIARGYESAAAQFGSDTHPLGLRPAEPLDRFQTPIMLEHSMTNEIVFRDTASDFTQLARFKFGKLGETPYTLKQLEKAILKVYGTHHYEEVNYSYLINGPEPKIEIQAKPRREVSFGAGMNYFSSSKTAILLQNELRNILSTPSVVYTNIRVAENYGVSSEYNYRLGQKKNFMLRLRGSLEKYEQNIYEFETIRRKFNEIAYSSNLGVGYEPNNRLYLGVLGGIEGFRKKPVEIIADGIESYRQFNVTGKLFLNYNSLDAVQFPTSGLFMASDFSYTSPRRSKLVTGDQLELEIPELDHFVSFSLAAIGYHSLARGVVVAADLHTGYHSEQVITNTYEVGGLESRSFQNISFIGLNTNQFHFQKMLKAGGELRLNLHKGFFTSIKVDYMQGKRTFQLLNAADISQDMSFWGYGVIAGLRTPLGPVKVAYGRNSATSRWNTNFIAGFNLF